MANKKVVDKQVVEVLGENLLINELFMAGLEVAHLVRDMGIDIVAYTRKGRKFIARSIQIKAASEKSFSVDTKYASHPNLLLVYVWNVNNSYEESVFYAMSYKELLSVLKKWRKTIREGKTRYSTSKPGKNLIKLLVPYKMTTKTWKNKILEGER